MAAKTAKYLVWGETGWIASHMMKLLRQQNKDFQSTSIRMDNQAEVCDLLEKVRPTHVLNCAGKTGRPNVDWCEDHKIETIESNVIGTLILNHACYKRDIHSTVLATGCIYTSQYTPDHSTVTSQPFHEEDTANFGGSFYSYTKSRVEDVLKNYPKTLILRIRMPVSDDLHDRSFVRKITKYTNVVNIPNSHSILHDLLPVVLVLAENQETGVVNFTNPGAVSHNEVLALYKEIIDPKFKWKNFSLEQQGEVVKAERSNCVLDCSKLMELVKRYQGEGYDIAVPEVHDAYRQCFGRMKPIIQQYAGAQVSV